MSRANEIYPLERIIERELKKAEADPNNADAILRYYHARVSDRISLARICKCLNTIRQISKRLNKPFSAATKDDFRKLVSELERSNLAAWTKRDYKVILKHFYKWFRDWEDGSPPEVRWIKKNHVAENKRQILPKDLLTPEEKMAMLRATQNPRDRAMLEVYFECGRRMGEVMTTHIQDVEFDSLGAKIHVNGKVGDDFVRIISAAPSLAVWLDNHPLRDNQDAPVWIGLGHSNRLKQLNYGAARMLIKKIAKRAGITKRIFFYIFRYTRIDETQGILTEAQQCMMFGWKFGSRMPATYFKRYGKHIDNAQAIMNGVELPKKESFQPMVAKTCFRCNNSNSPAAKFCNSCGNVLDIQTAIQIDEKKRKAEILLENIIQDPEKMKKLLQLVE